MKVIHYVNQFFGGVGGEEKADQPPLIQEGLVGPAIALNAALKGATVTHTIICGDNFVATHTDEAVKQVLALLEGKEFDVFVAGPAFQAGRYGFACGTICKAIKEKFNIPVFSSMHIENPGVDMFKLDMPIFVGGKSVAKMKEDVEAIAAYINKIVANEPRGGALAEGFYPRGIRAQVLREDKKPAARRVVEMFLKKINNEPFETEFIIPPRDLVPIADAIKDLSKMKIALVSTGGVIPVDNPDRIQSSSATRWGRYDIANLSTLEPGVYKTIHCGFDPTAANADPHVIMPLDALRALEKEGKFGSLHDHFYTTVGTGTTQGEAKRMAQEMVPFLKKDGVDAVLFVATWGTCTRCGASMVKEFERAGFNVVIMTNLVPVAVSVGANRIVPTISIPYPMGDPSTPQEAQFKLRKHLVGCAIDSMGVTITEQTVFAV